MWAKHDICWPHDNSVGNIVLNSMGTIILKTAGTMRGGSRLVGTEVPCKKSSKNNVCLDGSLSF